MSLGEAITTARCARGLTQKVLSARLGITQAALSRHENDLREPSEERLKEIASALGVTSGLLLRAGRMRGAIAVGAHMRRRATARPTVWRRLEAQLNLHRLHARRILEHVDLYADLTIPWFDPFAFDPVTAARLLRAEWGLPVGPVRDLTGWIEKTGCLIFESDFGTGRVDGLSQWVDPYPVIMLNSTAPTDRRRLKLAHELGHLCLHSQGVPDDYESDATSFAAEFLMPAEVIRPQLRNVTTGRLHDLKRYWGVSMQSLIERGFHLGVIPAKQRTYLYKRFSALGWRTHEPVSDELPPERARLVSDIGQAMLERGLTASEISAITGYAPESSDNPFLNSGPRLRIVRARPE
ncbi:MAG: ImmA/IrrE family metallo-endopeptidase [Acidimicrobiia bacterium]|nr:ImmA/IrrE family metallo-endopeptidase [Acidimicrobiia bacterium]